MKNFATSYLRLAMLSTALLLSPLAYSQTSPQALQTGPASEASPMFQRHHAMAAIMKDMVVEMARMQEDMGKNEMTAGARKQMVANMKRMSDMMRRMSGLADRPTMNEPQARQQVEDMRRQMDEMSRSHAMGNSGEPK